MSLGLVKRRSFMLGYDWNTVNGTGNISLSKSMKSNFRNVEILGNSRHKTYAGTQLFDASKFSTTSAGGATLTNNGDGSFTISGTGNSNSELYIDYVYTHEETIELLKAGSITIKTSSVSNPRVDVSLRKADGIYVGLSNRYNPVDSVEIKQEFLDDPNSKLMLSFYMPSNSEIKPGTIKPMLYQNSAGKWEPFTGGKPVTEPSPDNPQEIKSAGKWNKEKQKYEIDVKVTGKNLAIGKLYYCSYSRAIGCTNNLEEATLPFRPKSETQGVGYVVPCKKGVTYTFSVTNPNENVCTGITEYTDLNSTINIEKKVGNTLKSKDNSTYTAIGNGVLLCFVAGVWTDGTTTLHECTESELLQLEIGNIPTEYEPYTEQTVQIALDEPLRGIKRPSNREFIQETLSQSGIIRRFKEIEITKNARILTHLGNYGAPEINSILARYPDASLKKTGAILCGELKNINNWNVEKESVATTEQGIDFRLSRERLGLGNNTTPEENKVAVIKYLENHPLHCIAELNEPITEPLPESVQQQLQALHSENVTTHAFVDSGEVPAGIEATYKMKSN